MLAAFLCVFTVFLILAVSEILWRTQALRGEWLRKFVHTSVAGFVAFWPWMMSWGWIQAIGVAFLAGTLINRKLKIFNMLAGVRKASFGDLDFALAILACALLTNVKIFFCLAILNLAIADSFAALAGQKWGKSWRYNVFGQSKTLVGTMVFWLASLGIFGVGGLFAHNMLPFSSYLVLVVALPPVLTLLENVSWRGIDNVSVPITAVLALRLLA